MRYQLPRGYRRYLLGLAMLALLCIAAAVTVFFVPVQTTAAGAILVKR